MNNTTQIWNYHDNKMIELKRIYNRISKQTQNRLQEIFNSIDFSGEYMYNIADKNHKDRISTYIEEWKEKGLLTGYFGILANNIYKRSRVKNSEILELLIYGAYIEEQSKLNKYEEQTMYDDANYYYQQGQEEVNKTLNKKKSISSLDMALFLYLMTQPNVKGYVWKQYIETIIKYNTDMLYRQMIIDLQQQRQLDITNNIYQNIIRRQGNSKLNIKNNKISGDIDLQIIGINNQSKLEGIKRLDNNAKIKFLGILDEKETDMCHSLDRQEFYINKNNEFDRYYGETQKDLRIERIKCFGLVLGLNLPPISRHFHWCRSSITYQTIKEELIDTSNDENIFQDFNINNFIKKNITKQKYKLINQSFKNEEIRKIALNNDIKKIYIHGKKSYHKANEIYLNANWNNRNKGSQERAIRHEVGHAIDYKYGYISTKGEIGTALEIDKKEILKYPQRIKDTLNSNEYKQYAELSDIVGGLTNNKIRGRYIHSNEYWKRRGALEKETFADLFSIAGNNNLEYLKIINKYLPNTLKAFDGLIRRIK